MQPRDTSRLERDQFDLLVVGGGIQGLAIAYDAASRGLRTALIEAADFGSGISFNHQKTVHGGLRSLQSLRLDRAREGIRERRAFGRIAPWLLRPLPFVIGTYRSLLKGRTALRAGFAADRWLGWDRNAGVERELHLPPPRLLSRGLTLKLFPGIREDGLTGGAQWYDYQMVENDRLTFAFAAAADRAGAVLVNEVEATGVLRDGGRVAGVEARDAATGARIDIRAALTVNAAGAGAEALMRQFGVPRSVPLLAAMNLVVRREAREIALAAPTRSGRMLTLVPWRGQAIVGTGHSDRLVSPDARTPAAAEIDQLVAEANEAFPALRLTRDDVTLVHRGLVPAAVGRGGPDLLGTPRILDHADEGAPGAMTVIGVKYTTARGVAEARRRRGRSPAGPIRRPLLHRHDAAARRRAGRPRGSRHRDRPHPPRRAAGRRPAAAQHPVRRASGRPHRADRRPAGAGRTARPVTGDRRRRGDPCDPSRDGAAPDRYRAPSNHGGRAGHPGADDRRRLRAACGRGVRVDTGAHG